jgi:hypothetical protein
MTNKTTHSATIHIESHMDDPEYTVTATFGPVDDGSQYEETLLPTAYEVAGRLIATLAEDAEDGEVLPERLN